MTDQDRHEVLYYRNGMPARCACGYSPWDTLSTSNSGPDEGMVRRALEAHVQEANAPYVRVNEGETVVLPPAGDRGYALILRRTPGGLVQSAQYWPWPTPLDDQLPHDDEFGSDGYPIFREWRSA